MMSFPHSLVSAELVNDKGVSCGLRTEKECVLLSLMLDSLGMLGLNQFSLLEAKFVIIWNAILSSIEQNLLQRRFNCLS